jgi:hypothetical protein
MSPSILPMNSWSFVSSTEVFVLIVVGLLEKIRPPRMRFVQWREHTGQGREFEKIEIDASPSK